jgi:tRNA-dihydrouridine synthase
LLQVFYGDETAVKEIRSHVAWYTKGLPSSASFRSKLSAIREKEELFEAIESYFNLVERRISCQSFPSAKSRSVTGSEEEAF